MILKYLVTLAGEGPVDARKLVIEIVKWSGWVAAIGQVVLAQWPS